MKSSNNIFFTLAGALFLFASCQKESVKPAQVEEISFFHSSKANKDSLVTEASVGRLLTVKVNTNADICTLWPAGDRLTVKSILKPAADSLDINGKPVLVRSDDFVDYGLLFARGKLMTGSKTAGYSFQYNYTRPGTYKVVIITTVHGNSTDGYRNNIIEKTLVVK